MVSYVISTGKSVESEKSPVETSKSEKHSFKVGDLVTSIGTDRDIKIDDILFTKGMVFSEPKKIAYVVSNERDLFVIDGLPYIYTADMLMPVEKKRQGKHQEYSRQDEA